MTEASSKKINWALWGTVAAIAVVTAFTVVGSYISAANYGNRAEQGIKAQHTQNKNVLAGYTKKIMESVQVADMYKDGFKEVVSAAMEGRYGAGGSKAVFQWIKEADLKFDPSVYTKLQQLIESGRNEFQNEQKTLIDLKRGYETNLGYVWTGYWLARAGYPKINLDDYKVVLTEGTEQSFKSGVEAPLKLR